jgi:hypothetical protein
MTVITPAAHHQHSTLVSAVPATSAGASTTQMQDITSTPGDGLRLDVTSDPPLDTPFLQPVGAISRPSSFTARSSISNPTLAAADKTAGLMGSNYLSCSMPRSSNSPPASLQGGSNDGYSGSSGDSSRRSLDIWAQASMGGAASYLSTAGKHVSWFDSGFDASAAFKGSLSGMHGMLSSAQPAGNCHAGLSNSNNSSALPSVHSAPASWGTAGDLRDQGRTSSAGAPGLGAASAGNSAGNSFSTGHTAWLAAGCDVVDEAGTPMQVRRGCASCMP